jgi:glutamine amidotransferase
MHVKSVAVLDYGSGNVHSVVKALTHAGAEVSLTADADEIRRADGLVVPGVGAFGAVMTKLRENRGDQLIRDRLAQGAPVLGICVGLQILFENSSESASVTSGMGLLRGKVSRLTAQHLPHMGWNTVDVAHGSKLFAGIEDERFYFVHSYAVASERHSGDTSGCDSTVLATHAQHESARFIAAIEAGPLCATQFHPEKSGSAGLALLHNWIRGL